MVYWCKEVVYITEKFEKLDSAKKKIILDAAFEEFGEQGYDKASTNHIVKKAKIGKGMLFYYFNSKKELFHYLINYGIDYVLDKSLSKIDENETDFIEKYRQITQVKMKSYIEQAYLFNFFATLYINEYDELPQEIKDRLDEVRDLGYAKTFKNIDKSLFRDDINSDEIIRLINLTMSGYENEITNLLKGKNLSSVDYDPFWDDFDNLLDLLRKIYYK